MSTNYKFTDEQLSKIDKLENPSLSKIIKLGKELELNPEMIAHYLINKELRESEDN